MTDSSSWRPLVTGGLADRLRASLAETLVAMVSRPALDVDPWSALLYAYSDLADRSDKHTAAFDDVFERALVSVSEGVHSASLYGGFTGVAWLANHVTEAEDSDEDPYNEVDQTLHRLLAQSPWRGEYDLINGLVGLGVYFLERLKVSRARLVASCCLELIVDHLGQLAKHTRAGTAWHTEPRFIPEWQRMIAPDGYYNLGVAHGNPGVLALLGQLCEANIGGPRARELLARGVDWLLAQPHAQGPSRFAAWRVEGAPNLSSRVAWCYGDVGVSAALLRAARCVHEPRWERQAVEIARNAATWRTDSPGMPQDAALCHGAAGIAHIFNRIFQATGDEAFEDAARYWYERTLEVRRPGEGIAGYRAFASATRDTPAAWLDRAGFLEGTAGIGLALLAATSDIEPSWDRVLLVSIPPR